MKKLSTDQKVQLFDLNTPMLKHYKKRGRFIFRDGIIGETVLTIVAGKLETLKTITVPSKVLRNIEVGSSAETYIIDQAKFFNRYEVLDQPYLIDGKNWGSALAKGEVLAFEYQGEAMTIVAAWNEEMIVEVGDYIARPIGGDPTDIYRIEKDTFKQTYYELTSPN